jgi:hypothetical protein
MCQVTVNMKYRAGQHSGREDVQFSYLRYLAYYSDLRFALFPSSSDKMLDGTPPTQPAYSKSLPGSTVSNIHSFINGFTAPLLDPGLFSSLVILFLNRRLDFLDGGSARHKAANYTQNKRTQKSMPEWDSKPRFQCSSERRQFMP